MALDWQDVRVFLALGRHRSLSAAARALGVNHATVARRIQALEESLGEKLVERRPGGYVLTAAGDSTLQAAAAMEAAAQTLTRPMQAAEDEVRGLVRINAPPALAQGFILARLAGLAARHPGLDVELASNLRPVSLDRHKADIAVRIGHPADADLIARPLGQMAYGFYGTAARCEAWERGEPPVFVGFDEGGFDLPESAWLSREFPRARIALRTENHVLQAIAARSDAGIALLPHYIGRPLTDLRLCACGPVPSPRDMWLLIRGQDRNAAPVRAVMQHLVDAFAQDAALFRD